MHRFDKLTVGISGLTGTGKSTLARSLVTALNGKIGSFGDYVRYLARDRGASTERRSLQEIGETEVRRDVDKFVQGFLAWAMPSVDQALIVDGVRHLAVDAALRGWAEEVGRLYMRVHITASEELRASRRTAGDSAKLEAIDNHPVEHDAARLLGREADLVVDGTWNHASTLSTIIDFAAVRARANRVR